MVFSYVSCSWSLAFQVVVDDVFVPCRAQQVGALALGLLRSLAQNVRVIRRDSNPERLHRAANAGEECGGGFCFCVHS